MERLWARDLDHLIICKDIPQALRPSQRTVVFLLMESAPLHYHLEISSEWLQSSPQYSYIVPFLDLAQSSNLSRSQPLVIPFGQ